MKLHRSLLLSLALGTLACAAVSAQESKLTLVPTGATEKTGGYMPQRLALDTKAPDGLKKAPEGLASPLYGTLTMGPKEKPTSFLVILDEPEGKDSKLYVDANANGDLTDDPAPEWKRLERAGQKQPVTIGGADLPVAYGDQTTKLHVCIYRFDKATRPMFAKNLFYYADYAYEGEMTLGDKKYHVLLTDGLCTGDFRGKEGDNSGIRLMIDVNGNGRFDRRGESYDALKPFNVGGTTYEIKGLTAAGGVLQPAKSAQTVAEVLPPPDLGAGKAAVPFEATTTDGKKVSFPGDYKGKVVLLDFWATWCGPCMAEMPNVVAAYEKYHDQGFEILGISLDQPNATEKIAAVTKEKKMPWPQVYDGKFWQAAVAQLYVIDSIPHEFLVDGDTGKIIAEGGSLRGAGLAPAIEKALKK